MKRLLSFGTLFFLALVGVLLAAGSSNVVLWAACLLALPMMVGLAGGPRAYPVLLWVLGICWLQIVCDVVVADLEGNTIADDFGAYSEQALLYSLCAMFAMAAGMRCGKLFGNRLFGGHLWNKVSATNIANSPVDMNRLVIAYFAAAAGNAVLETIAWQIPGLTQPIIAFTLIKYVAIYLLAVTALKTRQGYAWLGLVVAFEILTGMISFFAAYKEAIFVVLIAFATARQKLNLRTVFFSIVAMAMVFWISVVWHTVKSEYRAISASMTTEQKFDYMAKQYLADDFDYQRGLTNLFQRIGYTTFYAKVLARQDAGLIAGGHDFYEKAVMHVLTPRILFPDKAALSDSAITSELLGGRINEETSIGVGYVAEAQVDFGFPGLLAPLWIIGALLALAAEYFMTRSAPLHICQAFSVAVLFNCFSFAADIDKSLGGFVTGFLAMALALKFGYPRVESWLSGSPLRRKMVAVRPSR
jgi:hypothetical protein